MKKNEKTNIVIQSFLVKIISDEWESLNNSETFHLCQYADFDKISDRIIADNEEIYSIIPWERVDRMKIVRVIARNIKIADLVDLSKFNYTIRETKNMLRIHPSLIHKIKTDLNTLKHEDAFALLTIGVEELSKKIDVKNYNFSPKEVYDIIEYNNFERRIILEINLKNLKDYHICDIIKNTGDEFFNLLDLNKLTARKWVEILSVQSQLLCCCNLNKFKESDIYNSVELISLFPRQDLDFLIKDRNYKEELSALGWEKLIITRPNEYIDECCSNKLNETNWKNILNYHPHLISYKP